MYQYNAIQSRLEIAGGNCMEVKEARKEKY